jgi:hypothetical protein
MGNLADGMRWFKREFGAMIEARLAGTPYSLDMLTAIATQETFSIWSRLYERMPAAEVLKLCVGDTIDGPKRKAFPTGKAALAGERRGSEMFAIARKALEDMAVHVPGYATAVRNPDKFCRGYGIFQYDLQHFETNPEHFLQRRWHDFRACLELCAIELDAARKRAYGSGKTRLDDQEMVFVAIAYNRGSVDFSKGFKQGHKDRDGVYYGEHMWNYLQLAHTVGSVAPPVPAAFPDAPRPPVLPGAGLF